MIPQVCESPVLNIAKRGPCTRTIAPAVPAEPPPSCPSRFSPQQCAAPEASSTQLWKPPTDTERAAPTSSTPLGTGARAAAAQHAKLVISMSPVGYWRFGETAGAVAYDESGNWRNGTYTGGVTLDQPGAMKGDRSALFDGVTGHVALGVDLSQWLGGTASLSVWIRTLEPGHDTEWMAPGITGVENSGDSNDVFWGWIDSQGRIGVRPGGKAGAKSVSAINDGEWRHVVMTRSVATGRCEVYVDGELEHAFDSPDVNVKTTPFSTLGRIHDTAGTHGQFSGRLDELAIFDYVVTPEEARAIFDAGAPDGPRVVVWREVGRD